eukprot:UN4988
MPIPRQVRVASTTSSGGLQGVTGRSSSCARSEQKRTSAPFPTSSPPSGATSAGRRAFWSLPAVSRKPGLSASRTTTTSSSISSQPTFVRPPTDQPCASPSGAASIGLSASQCRPPLSKTSSHSEPSPRHLDAGASASRRPVVVVLVWRVCCCIDSDAGKPAEWGVPHARTSTVYLI